MSWSFSYVARGRSTARRLAQERRDSSHVPGHVIDFVLAALDGLPDKYEDAIIEVNSTGHLCGGDGSHANSTCQTSVAPLLVSE